MGNDIEVGDEVEVCVENLPGYLQKYVGGLFWVTKILNVGFVELGHSPLQWPTNCLKIVSKAASNATGNYGTYDPQIYDLVTGQPAQGGISGHKIQGILNPPTWNIQAGEQEKQEAPRELTAEEKLIEYRRATRKMIGF